MKVYNAGHMVLYYYYYYYYYLLIFYFQLNFIFIVLFLISLNISLMLRINNWDYHYPLKNVLLFIIIRKIYKIKKTS